MNNKEQQCASAAGSCVTRNVTTLTSELANNLPTVLNRLNRPKKRSRGTHH